MTVWVQESTPNTAYTPIAKPTLDYSPEFDPLFPSAILFPSATLWPQQSSVWTRV